MADDFIRLLEQWRSSFEVELARNGEGCPKLATRRDLWVLLADHFTSALRLRSVLSVLAIDRFIGASMYQSMSVPLQRIARDSMKVVLDVAEGFDAADEHAKASRNRIIYLEDGLNDLVEEECGDSQSPKCLMAIYASQLAHYECSYHEESIQWSLGEGEESGWSREWSWWDTHQCCIEFKVADSSLTERPAALHEAWGEWLQLAFENTCSMTLDLSFAEEIARELRSRFWRSGTDDV